MKILNTKFKKVIFIVCIFFIVVVIVSVLLISPISKYLLEKYDVKYTGRQIKTGLVYVNPFTGYIYISNLKIYESKGMQVLTDPDSIFISARGLSINIGLLKLFRKTFEISEIILIRPKGIIIHNKKELNFSDIIRKFTPEKKDTTPSKFHFNILKIKIKNGEFYYHENVIPVKYYIKEANFESIGKSWNSDTMDIQYSFLSGTGSGSSKGYFTINFKNLDYRVSTVIHNFDLEFIGQYLKEFSNYGTFNAELEANLKATGNFYDQENINVTGLLEMRNFHFGKDKDDEYASFEKLVLSIEELNPKNHLYLFDSLLLDKPYLKYERYDYLDNLQMIFGKNGANISAAKANPSEFNLIIEIADYIKVLSKNFFESDYKIKKVAINNGCLKFSDYSLTEKFSIEANPLNFTADSVNKNRKRVEMYLNSGIKPYGNISVSLSINPNDSGDFDLKYHLQKIPAAIFNPYLITYTSFPLNRGTIELNGTWNVRNSIIKSDNHLLILDPRVATRFKNNDTKWMPASFILYLIQERGNVIDYDIPITGNLNYPKFRLRDVILDFLGNIFVNPATTTYRNQVKELENVIEKSLTLTWDLRQNTLKPEQVKFLNTMSDFLIKNPKASIDIYPMQYAEKEKEYISFFEAKKKYYLFSDNKNALTLSEIDSATVDEMSVKDPRFLQFINQKVNDSMLFTIEEKCNNYVGHDEVKSKFKQLNKEREYAFIVNFNNKALIDRIRINAGKNTTPYNGFSFYKIVYKGIFPESLLKAYLEMNELNHEVPRKRFKEEREKNKTDL